MSLGKTEVILYGDPNGPVTFVGSTEDARQAGLNNLDQAHLMLLDQLDAEDANRTPEEIAAAVQEHAKKNEIIKSALKVLQQRPKRR